MPIATTQGPRWLSLSLRRCSPGRAPGPRPKTPLSAAERLAAAIEDRDFAAVTFDGDTSPAQVDTEVDEIVGGLDGGSATVRIR